MDFLSISDEDIAALEEEYKIIQDRKAIPLEDEHLKLSHKRLDSLLLKLERSVPVLGKCFKHVGLNKIGTFDGSMFKKIRTEKKKYAKIRETLRVRWIKIDQGIFHSIVEPNVSKDLAVLCTSLLKGEKDITLLGAAQSGKTLLFVALACIFPVITKATGVSVFPLVATLNQVNPRASIWHEMIYFLEAYRFVFFKVKGKKESIRLDYIRTELLENTGSPECSGELADMIIQRMAFEYGDKKDSKSKQSMALALKNKNCLFLIINDEDHHGSAKNSIADKIHKFIPEELVYAQVFVSATPSETANHGFLIPQTLPENFVGEARYNHVILKNVKGEIPKQIPLVNMDKKFSDINFLHHDCVNSEVLFYEVVYKERHIRCENVKFSDFKGNKRAKKHFDEEHAIFVEQYISKLAKTLVKICTDKITKKNPLIFLRAFVRNKHSFSLISHMRECLEKHKEDIDIIQYFDDLEMNVFGRKDRKTLKDVCINDYVLKGKKAIILAGQGRAIMADSFPKEVKHFFDMFGPRSNHNADYQSTLGRAQGIGKESIVYLRGEYIEEIMKARSGNYTKKMGIRDVRGNVNGKGRPSNKVGISCDYKIKLAGEENSFKCSFDDMGDVGKETLERIKENMNDPFFKRITGGSGSFPEKANENLYEIFGEKFIRTLEEDIGGDIPFWGEIHFDEKGKKYIFGRKEIDGNLVIAPVGIRFLDISEVKNGLIKSNCPVKCTHFHGKQIQSVRPQILCTINGKESHIKRFLEDTRKNTKYSQLATHSGTYRANSTAVEKIIDEKGNTIRDGHPLWDKLIFEPISVHFYVRQYFPDKIILNPTTKSRHYELAQKTTSTVSEQVKMIEKIQQAVFEMKV